MVTGTGATGILSGTHNTLREGARLGLLVATSVWVWLAAVDAVAGEPFQTFTVLGGVALFTVMHYLLNLAYGVVIVSVIHGAAREPSLAVAVSVGLLYLEIWFAMVTVLLSHLGLGDLAWIRILGGSLLGTVITIGILFRTHPLASELRQAEAAENG